MLWHLLEGGAYLRPGGDGRKYGVSDVVILGGIVGFSSNYGTNGFTAQKMNSSIKDFFSKCDQIRSPNL